jgi:2-hydroxychromene-2-carboxylate isomerase
MARFIVGGRELDLTKDEVVRRMRNVRPEPIREHVVEISGTEFPPKQVLEQVTGWDRRSYTTMEANRVLTRLGLPSRRAAHGPGGHEDLGRGIPATFDRRLSAVEAALSVAQEAIAALRDRVSKLETRT